MLTSNEVLKATGIKSVRTLQRWHERKLVPPPTLQRHPSGHGMTWMWPLWITRHIGAINKRVAAGETLDDVARTLSGDWKAEEKKWMRQRHDFKAAYDRTVRNEAVDHFAEWVSDSVYMFLRDIGIERPGRIDDKIWKAVSKSQFVNAVLELLREGFTPMMVITKDQITVTADFVLGAAFDNANVGVQPVLILPIRDAFMEAFATAEPKLPKEARFTPIRQVAERDESKTRVRGYRHEPTWKVKLDK